MKTHAETDGLFVEPLDVRRARAVGILAHPETAAALLAGTTDLPPPSDSAAADTGCWWQPLNTLRDTA